MPESLKLPFEAIAMRGVEQLDETTLEFCACVVGGMPSSGDSLRPSSQPDSLPAVARCWIGELWQCIVQRFACAEDDGLPDFPPELFAARPANLIRGLALLRRRWTHLLLGSTAELAELVRAVDALAAVTDRQVLAIHAMHHQVLAERADAFEHLAIVGQLASSIGHELRNPLATIENAAYLIAQRQASGRLDEPGLEKQVDRIRNQVQLATHIVDDVLSMAKQRQPRCSIVAVRALIDSAIEAVQTPGVSPIARSIAEDLTVWGDAQQLRLVFTNLLTNAVQAVAAQGKVEVTAGACDRGVAIRIADDGPGIPLAARLRIFEPLFTTKTSGHGLGLSLCRRIVDAHGGTLSLESSEVGAVFRLWLPGVGASPDKIA